MEIYTGIDIVENGRIKKVYEKYRDRFLKKVFTENELNYCFSQKEVIPCLSARFACKEAVVKAYFQAFKQILHFKQIEVLGEKGKPATVLLHLEKEPSKPYKINISIAHEKKFSTAIAIIYL
ncbi:MAG: holo-[acyl-carrier-protein] synthase [Persephonella sp.]|nr:MAG: holo-[acyl-carrier-protein] synthase [Persephonella sp.]